MAVRSKPVRCAAEGHAEKRENDAKRASALLALDPSRPVPWGSSLRKSIVFIIDAPLPDPTEEFQKTKIYKIVSDGTASCYIGHTTKTLDERFEAHQHEYKDTKKRKRCSSSEILKQECQD